MNEESYFRNRGDSCRAIRGKEKRGRSKVVGDILGQTPEIFRRTRISKILTFSDNDFFINKSYWGRPSHCSA